MINVVEYVDKPGKRGAVYSTDNSGSVRIWLYKFADDTLNYDKLKYSFVIIGKSILQSENVSVFIAKARSKSRWLLLRFAIKQLIKGDEINFTFECDHLRHVWSLDRNIYLHNLLSRTQISICEIIAEQ